MKRLRIILTAAVSLTMTAITVRASDSKADLSDLTDTDLQEAAQIDAQEYFASHKQLNTSYTGEIGTAPRYSPSPTEKPATDIRGGLLRNLGRLDRRGKLKL